MSMKNIELWLDWRVTHDDGAQTVPPETVPLISRVVVLSDSIPLPEELQGLPRLQEDPATSKLFEVSSSGATRLVGAAIDVETPDSQRQATSLVGCVDWIQLSCKDWTMIPAENLISIADGSPTKVCVKACEASHIQGLAYALQIGVDALLLEAQTDLWNEAKTVQDNRKQQKESTFDQQTEDNSNRGLSLSKAEIVEIIEGGVGDRLCLDLIQTLQEGEGCLVGSSAKALVLVHAETFSSGFVPARPFRVNAGPVHSYVLMGDGQTSKYLCEVQAGDQVLVVDANGNTRAVTVGRCKSEPRPMLMVKFKEDTTAYQQMNQVFLQQAETVRLFSPHSKNGEAPGGDQESKGASSWFVLPVTTAKPHNHILVLFQQRGTHLGRKINAKVTET